MLPPISTSFQCHLWPQLLPTFLSDLISFLTTERLSLDTEELKMRTKWRVRKEAQEAEGRNTIQFSPAYLHPLGSISDFPTLAATPAGKVRPHLGVAAAADWLLLLHRRRQQKSQARNA